MIFGFAGERFCGKDTAAKYFEKKHGFLHLKFAGKLKRAVEILFDLPDDWDWDVDKEVPCDHFNGYTKREVLQWYGTEGLPEDLCVQFNFYRHLKPIIQVLFDCGDKVNLANATAPYDMPSVVEAIARGGFRKNVDPKFWLNIVIPKPIREEENWQEKYDIGISDTRFKNEVTDLVWENHGFLVFIDNPRATSVPTNHASEENLSWLTARADYRLLNNGSINDYHLMLEAMYESAKKRRIDLLGRRQTKTPYPSEEEVRWKF